VISGAEPWAPKWLTYRTGVDHFGLVHLKGLTKLSKLDLQDTHRTRDGMEELKQALPSLKIIR
jgi:hypothetical protein